ncbi:MULTISPECIES: restriction endonuclease subunit S [Bacteroidales]|jgi:type I restriction enzyme S subunit|uniref:restriction endonuclease subunit S n=1 Tax=Bacteroidales TaxID=171549 RepID=UPI001C8CC725|nr:MULTISPECIES: restriction endonuclease subunit S [Bacteroidales]
MPHYENVPFEVPSSWVWTNIEELFFVTKLAGFEYTDCLTKDTISSNNEVPIVRAQNVRMGYFVENTNEAISEALSQQLERSALTKKCLLMTFIGAGIGDTCIFPALKRCHLAPNVAKIEPYSNKIDLKYALYYLMSDLGQLGVRGISKSTAQPSLSMATIRSLEIALPPLAEQHRIVAEIEKLFELIDQIEQGKADLQTIIKQTKSKILDLAIHGKLVPQDPNDEPAIELLKRINPDFTPCDNGHYTQLPDGWTACRLEQVADILDNLRKPINSSERDSRIRNRQIDELYPYYGATGQVGLIDDYIINGNYLLLGEDGAPFLDKNAIKAYSISGKSWVNNHAHILSPKIDFEFLQYSLNQIDYSEYVNGSTRLKLTQTDMRSIKIMLPPLAEQKRIKSKIQILFSQLDLMMESL